MICVTPSQEQQDRVDRERWRQHPGPSQVTPKDRSEWKPSSTAKQRAVGSSLKADHYQSFHNNSTLETNNSSKNHTVYWF